MPPLPGDVQWFPAEIRRLIVAIKKYETLYNPRSESFGLREYQARAWKSVAEQVGGGKTDVQCRDKWNCLRGTYRRHVRTEATNAVKRRSGWPWADMMSFIKPHVVEHHEIPETRSGSKTPPTIKPAVTTQTVVLGQPTIKMVKAGIPLAHKPNCPMTNKLTPVSISTASGVQGAGTLTLASNMFPGGIIFNTRGGIGIVQPNQTNVIGVVQPSQVNLVQSSQAPVFVTSQSGAGVGVVQPTKTTVTEKNENVTSVKSKSPNPEPIEIDLKSVKHDPDTLNVPASTEFVDMEVAIKKEPMEEEELQLPENFTFFPEESTQENSQDEILSRESGGRSPDKSLLDQSQEDIDSNELFMRSTVSHMRKLSAYEQSVFKLKVQQLLHEMMFPKQT